MTTMKSILCRLTQAVSGTDKELFSEQELNKFASFYLDKWDENTSEDVVAESFVDYWWNTDRACRRCSECGKLMREGYCADMGVAYYCSKECLHSDFTDEEWAEECESNDQSFIQNGNPDVSPDTWVVRGSVKELSPDTRTFVHVNTYIQKILYYVIENHYIRQS